MFRVEEIDLLGEVGELLVDLNGFTENDFLLAGLTCHELMNPTEETLVKLRDFHATVLVDDINFQPFRR